MKPLRQDKKPRKKKCRHSKCRKWFQPFRSTQVVCNNAVCALEYARESKLEKERKATKELRKRFKQNDRSHQLKLTQQVFNEYIRLRDSADPCISCGTMEAPEWCAGHYRTRGAASQLRFNVDNVHKQCNRHCNLALSGNLINYRIGLIKKIGLERVEALENDNSTRKWTCEELIEMRSKFRAMIRDMRRKAA